MREEQEPTSISSSAIDWFSSIESIGSNRIGIDGLIFDDVWCIVINNKNSSSRLLNDSLSFWTCFHQNWFWYLFFFLILPYFRVYNVIKGSIHKILTEKYLLKLFVTLLWGKYLFCLFKFFLDTLLSLV